MMEQCREISPDDSTPGRDAVRVRDFYKPEAIAESYDRDRFSSLPGRAFDVLEKAALGRAMKQAREGIDDPLVFDAPCGTGRVTEWLLQHGFRVAAADISEAMMAIAARRCAAFRDSVTFMCADLERLAVPDESFDLTTCIRLFHHLPTSDRARILNHLSRATRHCVIANVSLSTPYYRWRRDLKRLLRQGVSRQSSTYAEIDAEARQAGLHVAGLHFVAPYLSEDVVIVYRKAAAARPGVTHRGRI